MAVKSIQKEIDRAIQGLEFAKEGYLEAVAQIQSAGLIALAIERLAVAQERTAKAQERAAVAQELQFKVAQGMMNQVSPMIEKTNDLMEQEMGGDKWKYGADDEDEDNDDYEEGLGGCHGHR